MRKLAWAAYLVATVAAWALAAGQGEAGHTIGGGDCNSSPQLCRNTYVQDHVLCIRTIDQFSSQRPAWYSSANIAVGNWTGNLQSTPPCSVGGPQCVSWTPHSGDSWDYMKIGNCTEALEADGACTPTEFQHEDLRITQNCNSSFADPRSAASIAFVIQWSEIWANESRFVAASTPLRDEAILFFTDLGGSLDVIGWSGWYKVNDGVVAPPPYVVESSKSEAPIAGETVDELKSQVEAALVQ